MKVLFSKLENNVFSDVLIKKGRNLITDKDFEKLSTDYAFNRFWLAGFIGMGVPFFKVQDGTMEIVEPVENIVEELTQTENKLNFDEMSYQELKTYVAENNIEATSNKKADLLEAIKNSL